MGVAQQGHADAGAGTPTGSSCRGLPTVLVEVLRVRPEARVVPVPGRVVAGQVVGEQRAGVAAAAVAQVKRPAVGGQAFGLTQLTGARLQPVLRSWLGYDPVLAVAGLVGLIVGIELRGRVTPVLKNLQDRGVLALPAGFNVLRLLPPLIITENELNTVIDAIRESLDD